MSLFLLNHNVLCHQAPWLLFGIRCYFKKNVVFSPTPPPQILDFSKESLCNFHGIGIFFCLNFQMHNRFALKTASSSPKDCLASQPNDKHWSSWRQSRANSHISLVEVRCPHSKMLCARIVIKWSLILIRQRLLQHPVPNTLSSPLFGGRWGPGDRDPHSVLVLLLTPGDSEQPQQTSHAVTR